MRLRAGYTALILLTAAHCAPRTAPRAEPSPEEARLVGSPGGPAPDAPPHAEPAPDRGRIVGSGGRR
jgi:hypothetical protein